MSFPLLHTEFLHHLSIPFSKPLYDGLIWIYQTKIKWQGSDYDSSRIYDTSDHPKYIDRKTTAKKNTLYSKQYHEEQQLHVCLVLDIGSSMNFWFTGKTKYDIMKNISILLGSLITANNDSCSIISYDQDIKELQINLTSTSVIPMIIKILTTDKRQTTTSNTLHSNLTSCIWHFPSIITHPTHFIFMSDDQDENIFSLLRGLRKKHEYTYILLQHSLELQWVHDILVSDGIQTNYINKEYPEQIHNKNLLWKQEINRLWWYFLHLTEQSDIQKSLLSLWR